jgi:hypothetical protein
VVCRGSGAKAAKRQDKTGISGIFASDGMGIAAGASKRFWGRNGPFWVDFVSKRPEMDRKSAVGIGDDFLMIVPL